MAWYYVDAAGATKGPTTDADIIAQYKAKSITDETYVWNGTSVNAWIQVKTPTVQAALPGLKAQPKPAPPKPKPAPPVQQAATPKRRNPMGGGRSALLASIQKGKALKKAKKPKEVKKKPMSLQEQMAAKLGGMRKKGGGGRSKPTPKKSPINKTPAKKWGTVGGAGNKSSGGGGGSAKVYVDRIKRKLNGNFSSDDIWKLKAIEKILS